MIDFGFGGKPDVVTLQVEHQGQVSQELRLTGDEPEVSFRAADGSRVTGRADDAAVIRRWLVAGGVPSGAAELDADAADIADMVVQWQGTQPRITTSRFRHGGSSSSGSYHGPDPRYGWTMLALALAVYAGGIGLYFRLRPRASGGG